MNIDSIHSGIVLDHITAGRGMDVYRYLKLDELDCPVAYMRNVRSNALGRKDIIKIDADINVDLDVLYMTRVQKERFFNEADYIRLKDTYILDPEKLRTAKADMSILHPLPRVNEISPKVDDDPRAVYFKQVRNGRFVRMALIHTLLNWQKEA